MLQKVCRPSMNYFFYILICIYRLFTSAYIEMQTIPMTKMKTTKSMYWAHYLATYTLPCDIPSPHNQHGLLCCWYNTYGLVSCLVLNLDYRTQTLATFWSHIQICWKKIALTNLKDFGNVENTENTEKWLFSSSLPATFGSLCLLLK